MTDIEYLKLCLEGARNRIDDDTETINRQCKELGKFRALEEAAREARQLLKNAQINACFCDPPEVICDWCRIEQRLAKVLEGK